MEFQPQIRALRWGYRTFVSTVAEPFVRLKDITDELNRRGVPAARGANGWYRSGVARLLTRLRALELKRTSDRAESATLPGARLPPG